MNITRNMRNACRPFAFAAMLAAGAACTTPETLHHQSIFATPDKAAEALVDAVSRGDRQAELRILGPDAEPLMHSGDPVADREGMKLFLAAYDSGHKTMPGEQDRRILILGHQEWPFPIPLARAGGGWRFDTQAAKDEILNRRIGRNELNVIEVCHAYAEAQREYAAFHITHGRHEYAQRFISTPGKQDGLYWPAEDGAKESPFGPLIAEAATEGYMKDGVHFKRHPYHGYYFRILTQQGPHARGGAKTYLANKHMTGGFALVAYPARYGDSGIMTFIVNGHGIVYQKDLGPDTASIAQGMPAFDPDASWTVP